MTDNDILIEAVGLQKSFCSEQENIEVLRGVDFVVRSGETVAIRGESGSGKSTLLNVLSGLESHDAGSLKWGGEAVAKMSRAERARRRGLFIGFVFQAFYLAPELNVVENVVLPARIVGRFDSGTIERAEALLERVGLGHRIRHSSTKLSGGERQRVAVARALINRPKVLFADEPTGNLDEKNGVGVMDMICRLSEEEQTTLILVTHNVEFAARMKRVYLLTMGRFET